MTSQMLPQVSDDLRDFLETITASLRFTPKETLIFFRETSKLASLFSRCSHKACREAEILQVPAAGSQPPRSAGTDPLEDFGS